MRGLFITFEGPDGAGKTTQLGKLAERLRASGREVLVTREPGGTAIGDRIREILLSPDHGEMAGRAEVLLYAASRAQHVHERILPALRRGEIVLCDRFIDASIAYQAAGLGIAEEAVREINRFAGSGLQPDRTYLLDISEAESRGRLTARYGAAAGAGLDRIESRDREYHRKVRQAFLSIAERERERVRLVDAARRAEEIAADIYSDFCRWMQAFSV